MDDKTTPRCLCELTICKMVSSIISLILWSLYVFEISIISGFFFFFVCFWFFVVVAVVVVLFCFILCVFSQH